MNTFTSYFIAVPLPEKFRYEFESLVEDLKKMSLSIKTVYPKTPHVTLVYLDKQKKESLIKIAENIKRNIRLEKEIKLVIGDLGTFEKEGYEILFLNVNYPQELVFLNKKMLKDLAVFLAIDQLPFHPHVTLGKIINPIDKQTKELVKERLSKIKWEFKIEKIAIYGADSTKSPEFQEKLTNILI